MLGLGLVDHTECCDRAQPELKNERVCEQVKYLTDEAHDEPPFVTTTR